VAVLRAYQVNIIDDFERLVAGGVRSMSAHIAAAIVAAAAAGQSLMREVCADEMADLQGEKGA
jgi:hypothetical protein